MEEKWGILSPTIIIKDKEGLPILEIIIGKKNLCDWTTEFECEVSSLVTNYLTFGIHFIQFTNQTSYLYTCIAVKALGTIGCYRENFHRLARTGSHPFQFG